MIAQLPLFRRTYALAIEVVDHDNITLLALPEHATRHPAEWFPGVRLPLDHPVMAMADPGSGCWPGFDRWCDMAYAAAQEIYDRQRETR